MEKIKNWINEIYIVCVSIRANISKEGNEQYLHEATRKNKYSFRMLVVLMFPFEFYNMLRVLLFTEAKLTTLNNAIYFTMYLILFVSGIVYLIIEHNVKGNLRNLNRLYIVISFSWFLWHVVINYYDLTKDAFAGTATFIVAAFVCAVFFQSKPIYSIILNTVAYLIFSVLTYNIIGVGNLLNLSIVATMATVISARRYVYLLQTIKQNNKLTSLKDEIQQKQMELQLTLRKQKVIMEYTDDIIFEWDQKKDILKFSNNVQKICNFPVEIENARKWMNTTEDIHKDDALSIIKAFRRVTLRQQEKSIDFRIRGKTGSYSWYQARVFAQKEENETEVSVIGIITNIDEQYCRMQKLLIQSNSDLLTGLYNKVSTEQQIRRLVNNDYNGTMYMIDIDNFKVINDTLGHVVGDAVIVDVAKKIQEVFRNDDIIGRVGGDEFMVFSPNHADEASARNRAELLLEKLRKIHTDRNDSVKISASIGIYLATNENDTFNQLYEKADEALYKAKQQGRNQLCIAG